MDKIGRQFKRHNNKLYYEPGIFECEWVWLKRYNKRKLSTLYHGPYKVLSCSEQSMVIQKNSEVVKVSIRNVKAYSKSQVLYGNWYLQLKGTKSPHKLRLSF